MKRIEINKEQITGDAGLEIAVKGFQGDGGLPETQVYVEYYDGQLRIHVWDGSSEDPIASHIIPVSKEI